MPNILSLTICQRQIHTSDAFHEICRRVHAGVNGAPNTGVLGGNGNDGSDGGVGGNGGDGRVNQYQEVNQSGLTNIGDLQLALPFKSHACSQYT